MSKVIDSSDLIVNNTSDEFRRIVPINLDELSNWITCCEMAFSYQMAQNSVAQLFHNKNAQIWAYKIQQDIVATAISFKSNNTLGIHQVGVNPSYRGQGIAKNFMQFLIAHAIQLGCTEVSLQASSLGKPMYQTLGFTVLGALSKCKK